MVLAGGGRKEAVDVLEDGGSRVAWLGDERFGWMIAVAC